MDNPNKVVHTHRLSVLAVVCADGSAALCGVTLGVNPEGVQIVGNGTLPHPLKVELKGAYAVADELLAVLQEQLGPETDLTNAACHRGLCTAAQCGRCGKELRARAVIAKALKS